jgi:SP family general alpha glucoside:H+ symporter-like MFS transporter
VQWVLPALAIPLLFLTPESPTALVKLGKPEAALTSFKRFRPSETDEEILVRLAGAQLAVSASIEESQSQSTSYLECFKGTDLKRTLIVMMVSHIP